MSTPFPQCYAHPWGCPSESQGPQCPRNLERKVLHQLVSILRALLAGAWHSRWVFISFQSWTCPELLFHVFLRQSAQFFPTGSQLQLDNPHPFAVKDTQQPPAAPVIGKGLLLVMQGLRSFARPLPHLACAEISLNKVGNSLLTDRQLLSQLETS